MKNLEMLHG
jgi:hypothetical protein